MKKPVTVSSLILLTTLVTIICVQTGFGQSRTSIKVSPSIKFAGGETEYVLDAVGTDSVLGIARIRSQLEFPLDGLMAGATVGIEFGSGPRPPWFGDIGFWVSVTDPEGAMYDHDWTNLATGTYEKISYTESAAEMNQILFYARFGRAIIASESYDLGLFAGFRYQKIEQDVIGFEGWQIVDQAGTVVEISEPDLLGITYDLTLSVPHAGLKLDFYPANMTLSVDGAAALVMASDEDDHVLRNKMITSDVNGLGFLGGIDARFDFGPAVGPGPFLKVTGDFAYLHADGTHTQFWYADETSSGGTVIVPAGTTIAGIPHDITTTQFHFGLDIGYRF